MSRFSSLPEMAGVLSWARKVVYGPGYWRARDEAFARSGGWCQAVRSAASPGAHHWAWRYPSDQEITAADLTALCRPCHWVATLRRLTGRTQAGVWFVLAMATPPVRRRQRVARHTRRSCRGPERPVASRPATRTSEPDMRALIERCHLVLVVGCLACERYVRLDTVLSPRPCWRSMSVTHLRRRLCCCRCRSRTRWVLLGGWPPTGTRA